MITHAEFQLPVAQDMANVLQDDPQVKLLYPLHAVHYVEYAAGMWCVTLLKLEGLENTSATGPRWRTKLCTGGYKVYLAPDTQMQRPWKTRRTTTATIPSPRDPGRKPSAPKNPDGTFTDIIQPQAGAATTDYRTGEIKAIVGSRRRLQHPEDPEPGSGHEHAGGLHRGPISIYAPAFDLGAGAGSVAYNMPLPITGWMGSDRQDSWPQNYGGSSYRGPESFRTALVKSDTAAAWVMMNYVG